jgi:putative ABC transport system permease protein
VQTILAITLMNFRSLGNRLGTSMVIVVGIACVVGVLVGMLSMSRGFERTLRGTGSEGRALLLSTGVLAELSSGIGPDVMALARTLPGVKKGADGQPLVSGEIVVITELKKEVANKQASVNVALRGVEAAGLEMRPEVKLVAGRMFTRGLREVIAGRQATQQFEGVGVGQVLHFRGSEWTVVGVFDSGGDARESELWTDADTIRGAYSRAGASSLLMQLESPESLQALKDAITTDPRFQVDVYSERGYFTSQSAGVTANITILTTFVAVFMAIGAVFGALNTMFSAVATRAVEIATLRAIGFSGTPVVVSVMVEALTLAIVGGALGAGAAYLLVNGMSVSTLNNQSFTQVAFSFAVTPDLLLLGLISSVAIGFIGGLFPAVRAARLPIVVALRAA